MQSQPKADPEILNCQNEKTIDRLGENICSLTGQGPHIQMAHTTQWQKQEPKEKKWPNQNVYKT